ncbi:MAG: S41 family peptidase [Rhodothermales bacterium]
MKLRTPLLIVFVGVLGLVIGMQTQDAASSDPGTDNLRKIEEAFSFINRNYVERVDSAKLSADAIEGMLKGLDPHSIYIDAESMRRVRENFEASFEGIGIYYEFLEGPDERDTLAVLMPIAGGPSEEAGLLAGDRIINVSDTTAIGWETADVEKYLKGPKGTKVDVTVKRQGFERPLTFTITRDEIPLNTVIASHMIDETTGYIKLQRFARTSYDEFMTALRSLEAQGMERLVFDLRDNAGGLMEMAIRISDEFLPADDMIVYTRSRRGDFNREYRARAGGSFEDKPVIVLVNENSASASEIVAGALQDHDRALVVGRRTFGKGLVQQQFQLDDGSVLQMTISRYYTPAGRLIQTPYAKGEDEDEYYASKVELAKADRDHLRELIEQPGGLSGAIDATALAEEVPDSLRFQTDGGRTVYGGGGILPDYLVPADTISAALRTVIARSLDSEFSRAYLDGEGSALRDEWRSRENEFVRTFEPDDALFQSFIAYAEDHGVEIVERAPADDDEARDSVIARSELREARPLIEARVKAYLARRLFGIESFYPVVQTIDPIFMEAMELWPQASDLAVVTERRR